MRAGSRTSFAGAQRLIIVGGGFIGLELASAAASCGWNVTVIEAGAHLVMHSVPTEIEELLAARHRLGWGDLPSQPAGNGYTVGARDGRGRSDPATRRYDPCRDRGCVARRIGGGGGPRHRQWHRCQRYCGPAIRISLPRATRLLFLTGCSACALDSSAGRLPRNRASLPLGRWAARRTRHGSPTHRQGF